MPGLLRRIGRWFAAKREASPGQAEPRAKSSTAPSAAAVEQPRQNAAEAGKQKLPMPYVSLPKGAAALPAHVVAIDVETTGLSETDRVVSLGMILADTGGLRWDQLNIRLNHWIFNPGIPCNPRARHVHGYSDALLAIQETFADNQEDILGLLNGADLVIAHNVAFDIGFLNRELAAIGRPRVVTPSFCTMREHRHAYPGISAGLEVCASEIGLSRAGGRHAALEDAWLALMIYLHLKGGAFIKPFASLGLDPAPRNLRPLPPDLAEKEPPRKRKSVALEADTLTMLHRWASMTWTLLALAHANSPEAVADAIADIALFLASIEEQEPARARRMRQALAKDIAALRHEAEADPEGMRRRLDIPAGVPVLIDYPDALLISES